MVRVNGHTLVTVAEHIRLRDLRKVRNMVWTNVVLYAGETGHSYGLPIPLEQPRVSSLDVDICRHTDAHEYIFIVSWIQICGKTYTKIYT